MISLVYLPRSLLLAILATSCRSQYQVDTGMRADIRFNDENDRYDVGNIIQAQKQQFNDLPSQMEEAGDGFRRSSGSLFEVLKRERRRHQRGSDTRRMDNTDFVYHEPVSRVADDVDFINDEYGTNLATFKTYSNQNTRRTDNIKYKPSSKVKLHRSNRRTEHFFYANNLPMNNLTQKNEEKQREMKKIFKEKYDKMQEKTIETLHKLKQKNEDMQNKIKKKLDKLKEKNRKLEKQLIEKSKLQRNPWLLKPSAEPQNFITKILNYLNPNKYLRQGRMEMEISPEDETLVRYAVPLRMKSPGYLELVPQGLQYERRFRL